MIRMHCFSFSCLRAAFAARLMSGFTGPVFHKCDVAGWLGEEGSRKRDVPCMEIS